MHQYRHDDKSGTRKLCRFACVELGVMMTFSDVRGMWHKPLWRVEGKQNWLRARLCYGDSPMLVLGPNDELIVVDLKGFRRKLSDWSN